MPEAFLPPSIHMTALRDDVVILDVQADRYLCLPGAASAMHFPGPGVVSADDDILQDLIAEGLVDVEGPTSSRRPAIPARGELPLPLSPAVLDQLDTAVRTLAVTALFRKRSLSDLVVRGDQNSRPMTPARLARVAGRAAAYRAVLPFLPYEGLCLQRAYQLRQVLAADGLPVDWVFGVRTWPFFAHCWLQHDDLVIADRLERVRGFTPIAVF